MKKMSSTMTRRDSRNGSGNRRTMAKRAVAIILLLGMMASAGAACADSLIWSEFRMWLNEDSTPGSDGIASREVITVFSSFWSTMNGKKKEKSAAPAWDPSLLDRTFPKMVLRDVSRICDRWNGEEMLALGLVATGGSKLRSTPSLENNSNVLDSIHGSETIFIYFKATITKREWYYVVTDYGYEGFVAASRIMVFEDI